MERRGVQRSANNIDNERVILQYDLPLCEVVLDFHDTLKTISSGYASFDYENTGYQESSMVKVNIYKIFIIFHYILYLRILVSDLIKRDFGR